MKDRFITFLAIILCVQFIRLSSYVDRYTTQWIIAAAAIYGNYSQLFLLLTHTQKGYARARDSISRVDGDLSVSLFPDEFIPHNPMPPITHLLLQGRIISWLISLVLCIIITLASEIRIILFSYLAQRFDFLIMEALRSEEFYVFIVT